MNDSINNITEGATQNQRQARRQGDLALPANAPKPDCNHATDGDGEHDEKPALPAGCICQETECCSGVALVSDVDEGIDRNFVVQADPFDDRPFRQLVEPDDKYR